MQMTAKTLAAALVGAMLAACSATTEPVAEIETASASSPKDRTSGSLQTPERGSEDPGDLAAPDDDGPGVLDKDISNCDWNAGMCSYTSCVYSLSSGEYVCFDFTVDGSYCGCYSLCGIKPPECG